MDDSLKDIIYLLQLEAIKRSKDEEECINEVIAEKHEEYLEVHNAYMDIFSTYINIMAQCSTQNLLATNTKLSKTADLAKLSTNIINEITQKASVALLNFDYIHPNDIQQIHKLLGTTTRNENIKQQFKYTLSSSHLKKNIKGTLGGIENKLENAIAIGLDSMISKFNNLEIE